jgi:integrase
LKYTIPKINKGKEPVTIPKGSTKEKELAKNVWYISYTFNGKQYKVKEGLNRIKDHKQKTSEAESQRESIENDLKNGFDPEDQTAFIQKQIKQEITLADAVKNYLSDIEHTRPTTAKNYESKLKYLVEAFPGKPLKNISGADITRYLRSKIDNVQPDKMTMKGKIYQLESTTKWTNKTVQNARTYFRTFFNWCIHKEQGYISENPITDVLQRKIRSEATAKDTNIPYSEKDTKTVMTYLDEHDPYIAFICRFIYSTCLRPRELCQLQVKDLTYPKADAWQITIPLSAMKTTKKTKPDVIDVEPNFIEHLEKLNHTQYPDNYYLVSDDEINIIGAEPIDPDKPYKRLRVVLKKLKLDQKGYTLYSFKHTSNIARFNKGWLLTEIMKANRHSDIQSTLEYLKHITKSTDISKKEVPKI